MVPVRAEQQMFVRQIQLKASVAAVTPDHKTAPSGASQDLTRGHPKPIKQGF